MTIESLLGSYNGLTFGQGTDYLVYFSDGLQGRPDIRRNMAPRGNAHGAFLSDDFFAERVISLQFFIVASDIATWRDRVDEFLDAMNTIETHTLSVFDNTRQMEARVSRAHVSDSYPDSHFATVEFVAPDPRLYGTTLHSDSCNLRSLGGGVMPPITFPLTFNTVATGGTLTISNAGAFPTYPTAIVTGPVINPKITNVTDDYYIEFELDLASGDILTIDFANASAVVDDVELRRTLVGGSAALADFVLNPGTTELMFEANAYNTTGELEVQWRDAWI